ncbi:DUF4085 family protein [Lysinibacillus sp. KU-BSD001]|uniref:DUF4085 family protein n=1 Tax=Lysinibacillus sp. KU-BSD001 TaxID=3141328 RepID=UPI0036EAFCBA
MWHLTLQKKKESEPAHILPIRETDDEWENDLQTAREEGMDLAAELQARLDEVRERLLQVLPEKFHPYIHNDTLNTPNLPKAVREEYLAWQVALEQTFREVLNHAYTMKQQAIPYLPQSAQEVFRDSLHDAVIVNIERVGNDVTIMLNTGGGFTPKAIVILQFINVIDEIGEIEVGSYYIYDELQKTARGFALRVIWECPEVEWTIACETIEAAFYFRPVAYFEQQEADFETFVDQLAPHMQYFFITDRVIPWDREKLEVSADGVYVRGIKVAESLVACKSLLYCDTYEDPYAIFSVPVPVEELEHAALSNDLEWQVRAFNTLYDNPMPHREVINHILQNIHIQENNEMMIYAAVTHFKARALLDETTTEKFKVWWD